MKIYLENPTGRDTKAYQVVLGNMSLFFSYSTCIAFFHGRVGYRIDNSWGPTTGRHMREMGLHEYPIIPGEEFNQRLAAALYDVACAETSDTKQLAYM